MRSRLGMNNPPTAVGGIYAHSIGDAYAYLRLDLLSESALLKIFFPPRNVWYSHPTPCKALAFVAASLKTDLKSILNLDLVT